VTDIQAAVNKAMGKDVLLRGSDPKFVVKYLRTGVLPFDILLQGGLPRGRFSMITGDWSTLKSYMGLCAIRETQLQGGVASLIDTEHAFDPDWATSVGVNVDDLLLQYPENGELAIDTAEALIRSDEVDLLVIDSVAATLPQQEQEKRLYKENIQPGRQAALMSAASRRMTTANNGKTAVLWVNQLRENIGMTFGPREKAPGGRALPFYSCLVPGTKVLRSDFRWVSVETLKPGDMLVGFDEYATEGTNRKMRLAEVIGNDKIIKDCYEIETDRGVTTASAEHKWLVETHPYPSKSMLGWKRTDELEPDDNIAWFAEPWDEGDSYEAVYLSGIYDGEGSVNTAMWTRNGNYKGWGITVVQKPGIVLDKIKSCLDTLGYRYREDVQTTGCHQLLLQGDLAMRMRFFGEVSPERLVNRIGDGWVGSVAVSRGPGTGKKWASVKELRHVGRRTVYATGTTTETLFADGMFSHNSYILEVKKVGKITRDTRMYTGEKWQNSKEQIGQKFRIELSKSKLNKPFREIWFDWSLTEGEVDIIAFLFAQGLEHGLITVKGASYVYGDVKAVGKDKFKAALAANQQGMANLTADVTVANNGDKPVLVKPAPKQMKKRLVK
jgi:recombination protein RecA